MSNDSQKFETKPSSNKDLWLFLIVLDVIFLCVFGFFLYKHFAGQLVNPAPAQTVQSQPQEADALPEIVDETVLAVEENPVVVVDEPAPVQEVAPAAQPAPVVKEMEPVVEEKPAEQPQAKKESIVVTPTSGKYRRVTFRWFNPAEKVFIVSGFTNRKPQALKKVGDYWETTLSIAPGTYKFLYIVDGKNTTDPYAQEQDGRSILIVK